MSRTHGSTNKLLLATVAVAAAGIAAFAIYYGTRPGIAFHTLRQAVRLQDRGAMERLIDFSPLRESAKLKLRAELTARANASRNPLAMVGAILAEPLSDAFVDAAVTPNGIALMISGHRLSEANKPNAPRNADLSGGTSADAGIAYVSRWASLSEYVVSVNRSNTKIVDLVFRREGLFNWRLAGVR